MARASMNALFSTGIFLSMLIATSTASSGEWCTETPFFLASTPQKYSHKSQPEKDNHPDLPSLSWGGTTNSCPVYLLGVYGSESDTICQQMRAPESDAGPLIINTPSFFGTPCATLGERPSSSTIARCHSYFHGTS